MKYLVSAGEASGDLHGAELIAQIRRLDPQAEFVIMGGPLMAAAAQTEPILDYRRTAVMGFSEVIRNARSLLGHLRMMRGAIDDFRPDVFVPVDYPGFNLKLAAHAHKSGIKTAYYISPKLWAWKEWRGRVIRRNVDTMMCILPFEPEYYRNRHHYDGAVYVGNPSVEEMQHRLMQLPDEKSFRQQHGLPADIPLLALVPGSRRAEILSNLPVMVEAASSQPGLMPVIAAAPGIDPNLYARTAPGVRVLQDVTSGLMRHAEAALVTSGTATLECALIGTPQVVLYRSNGMRIAYEIMKKVISIDHVSLPNLIAGETVVPEMLVHRCTPRLVAEQLANIMPGTEGNARQLTGYERIADILGPAGTAERAARHVIATIQK